ncbi:MAG: SIS domain-containing protein [Acidobacteria bacterium]|nr:MAG: SIS domain-containing protein [Acidobacteriota bacterium]REK01326.1 MAG: SIS domain-containing protein [Acidobacteriota bacterium]REK14282.1 MAG: SIS domain-containing protein [Acidobacteriota bacterium]REK44997.1 MAG: SIS domain-containing protein [Acidobacteriota bacterium]
MSKMLREIRQQPDVIEKTIRAESTKLRKLGKFLRDRDVDLIVLAARGSSDNAAIFGRYLLEIACGIPVSLCAPSVYTLYKAKLDLKRALVIGISQSGEGTDVNTVLEQARKYGAFTLGITNSSRSPITKVSDETLLIHAGKERSVAATKTYTGQLLHFYLLANSLTTKAKINLEKLPEYASSALELESEVSEIAARYTFMENCVVVGRGFNYGNSFELALKLMETCYVVAERFSTADFQHGPLAVVERRFPVIHIGPRGAPKRTDLELLRRLKELNADCFSITNDRSIARASSRSVMLPAGISELLSPIPFIIPGQLFAAHLSAAKALDPDAPRSLSKITQTV